MRPDVFPGPHALGLDAGGTATRWALADARGLVWAEGNAAAMSGVQLADDDGRAAMAATLGQIAGALPQRASAVMAGITGLDAAGGADMQQLLSRAFGSAPVAAGSDIELLCRAAFAPAAGIVLYAGTGSIAALLDAEGQLQRAGGRGGVIDDAGGGHWLAREALRLVWRAEDAAPGAWRQSLLAQRVFERIGGSDWAHSRRFVYGASRGELGTLALAVADAARQGDATALSLLHSAGQELAWLVHALHGRHGPLPVATCGRVWALHPAIGEALRAALPVGTAVSAFNEPPHHAAARLAAALLPRSP
jgi:glucosamine kinase